MFKKPPREKKKKLPPGIDETFVSEVESAAPDALKNRIANFQAEIEHCYAYLKNDSALLSEKESEGAKKLQELKDEYDSVASPTKETIRHIQNKTKWILKALREKGAI